MRAIQFCILFILIPFIGKTQDWTTNKVLDSSYSNYLNYRHQAQIAYLTKALQAGFTFPIIYNRLGIAYLNLGNYADASEQFKHSLDCNKEDTIASYYLELCARLSGNDDLVYYLNRAESNPDEPIHPQGLQSVYGEFGQKVSSTSSQIGDIFYYHIGLQHRIGTRWNLYQAFSNLSQTLSWGSVVQYSYYMNSAVQLNTKHAWVFSGSYIYADITLPSKNATAPISSNDYLIESGWKYTKSKWMLYPHLGWFSVNSDVKWKAGITTAWQVFGNDRYVPELHMAAYSSAQGNPHIIANPAILIKLGSRVWLKTDYLYAKATNFALNNVYVIYNSNDLTQYRLGALLAVKLYSMLDWYLVYQFEEKTRQENQSVYNFNTFVTGIKINLH